MSMWLLIFFLWGGKGLRAEALNGSLPAKHSVLCYLAAPAQGNWLCSCCCSCQGKCCTQYM